MNTPTSPPTSTAQAAEQDIAAKVADLERLELGHPFSSRLRTRLLDELEDARANHAALALLDEPAEES